MYFSGIHQHKRDDPITTYDAAGQRVKQQRVTNDPARLRTYVAAFPGPHRALVESTGFCYWLADQLGVDLVLGPRASAQGDCRRQDQRSLLFRECDLDTDEGFVHRCRSLAAQRPCQELQSAARYLTLGQRATGLTAP